MWTQPVSEPTAAILDQNKYGWFISLIALCVIEDNKHIWPIKSYYYIGFCVIILLLYSKCLYLQHNEVITQTVSVSE